jgi:hypothetical protein
MHTVKILKLFFDLSACRIANVSAYWLDIDIERNQAKPKRMENKMFGITKSEGYYWVRIGQSTTKVGHKTFRSALAHLITGIA